MLMKFALTPRKALFLHEYDIENDNVDLKRQTIIWLCVCCEINDK